VQEPTVRDIRQSASTRKRMAKQDKDVQAIEAKAEEKQVMIEVSKDRLDKLVRQHIWGAMAVGLIPLPIVDFAAVTGVQINLLRKLAKEYHVRFFKHTVKNILSALFSSAVPAFSSAPLAFSLAKTIPVVGTTAGVVTMPILNGAATYALGKVFIQHFASGGTFLTFDPDKVKAYYAEMLKEGQKVASTMKAEQAAAGKV
jgi:uncharacterized protein (DUF697 family)